MAAGPIAERNQGKSNITFSLVALTLVTYENKVNFNSFQHELLSNDNRNNHLCMK